MHSTQRRRRYGPGWQKQQRKHRKKQQLRQRERRSDGAVDLSRCSCVGFPTHFLGLKAVRDSGEVETIMDAPVAPPPSSSSVPTTRARIIGTVDMSCVHRDLAGYYRAFGLMDSSTVAGLFDRVIWPNLHTGTGGPHPA